MVGFHSQPAAGRWKKTITKTGYDIAPLQSKWVKEKSNLNDELLSRD